MMNVLDGLESQANCSPLIKLCETTVVDAVDGNYVTCWRQHAGLEKCGISTLSEK